jgi:hypothetical protein
MDFALFILTTALLMIRPAEFMPDLEEVPIYEVVIILCLFIALPRVVRQLSVAALCERPLTLGIIALVPAVALSHLAQGEAVKAGSGMYEFSKVVIYYLLLVSIVNTPGRLRWFLFFLVVFILALTGLALLQFLGIKTFVPVKAVISTDIDHQTGREIAYNRLSTAFYDPNDLCLVLVVGMGISAYGIGDRRQSVMRWLWAGPLLLFGYALMLTHSRGGFLSLMVGVLALCQARFGGMKAIVAGGLGLAGLLVVFGGRQTDIKLGSGTSQSRIQLWSNGLQEFKNAPLFGIGEGRYTELAGSGHVAHNSFIHAYTELGLLGGTLFMGLFYFAAWNMHRLRAYCGWMADPEVARMHQYMFAILVAYCMGMLSLSRCYVVPTYQTLGLAAVYLRLGEHCSPFRMPRVGPALVGRLTMVSLVWLVVMYVFVKVAVRWA